MTFRVFERDPRCWLRLRRPSALAKRLAGKHARPEPRRAVSCLCPRAVLPMNHEGTCEARCDCARSGKGMRSMLRSAAALRMMWQRQINGDSRKGYQIRVIYPCAPMIATRGLGGDDGIWSGVVRATRLLWV